MNAAQLRVWHTASRFAAAAVILTVVVVTGWYVWKYFGGRGQTQQPFAFYRVTKADLPIVVTERGNMESQVRTEIRCEVENSIFDRSGNYGTQIIFIVPNGSAVKTGDLLVELDSAAIRDKLDLQTIELQRSISARIQAQAKYENQKTQNETLQAEAELKLKLAELQLEMYLDKETGEHKLSLDEIDRKIDEAKNQIYEAQAALELQKTEKAGIQTLFELGYRGRSDVEQSRFKFLQAEDKLAAAVNSLNTNQAARKQMDRYIFAMRSMTLEGDVETAERSLQQVITDNKSKLEQALAAKEEAEKTEAKEQERLAKLKLQLERCKIFAPHDGMVVYARESRYSNDTEISEGVTVRERQHILSLPDLTQMQVKTQIHEAVLDQVQPGLPVTVKVDAFPSRRYVGLVEDVAVVPNSSGWYGSSVKTYDCVVRIPERVENLKPGMTAVVDIHVDRIRNITAVPVQAVFQIDKQHWCYVDTPHGVDKKAVEIGRSNDKFVHILSGLALNENVVLNPMSILEAAGTSENEISPDADIPEAPEVPVEKVAENSASNRQAKVNQSREKGKRPPGPRTVKVDADKSQAAPGDAGASKANSAPVAAGAGE